MKTDTTKTLGHYAKVARTFPKNFSNGTNARVRALSISNNKI